MVYPSLWLLLKWLRFLLVMDLVVNADLSVIWLIFDGVAVLLSLRPCNVCVALGSVDVRLLCKVKFESSFRTCKLTWLTDCLDLWNELVWLYLLLFRRTGSFSLVTFLWIWRSNADFMYFATELFLTLFVYCLLYKSLPFGGESAMLWGLTGLVAELIVS